jgi:hypothetical protein
MSFSTGNEKIDTYLSELAEEYKKLIFSAVVEKSATVDEISISELLRIDQEIKKPLLSNYNKYKKLKRAFGFAGITYMLFGSFISVFNFTIWSESNIIDVVALITMLIGYIATLISFLGPDAIFNNKIIRKTLTNSDYPKYLEYEVIAKWREIEGIANDLFSDQKLSTSKSTLQKLHDNHYIDNNDDICLRKLLKLRNDIIHSMKRTYTNDELHQVLKDSDLVILKIRKDS